MSQQVIMRNPAGLKPHPDNPRGEIDPNDPKVIELSESLLQHGMIQPIVMSMKGFIFAGHRRRLAAIRAGISEVPTILRELKGGEVAEEIFLHENGQRQDLSPLEEARAIRAIKTKLERTQKKEFGIADLSRRLGIPKGTITNRFAILKLPERIQHLFHLCELPIGSATQLVRLLEWPEEIEKFADRMITRTITSASLDALITRRMHVLQAEGDERKRREREEGAAVGETAAKRNPTLYGKESSAIALTREFVTENLNKKLTESITMFNVKAVLDAVCCSCGMIGNREVCLSCPLPRFVNGLVGRASGGASTADEWDGDE